LIVSSKERKAKPKGGAEKLKLRKLKAEMGLGDYGTTDH
jgi:hypothetical protein